MVEGKEKVILHRRKRQRMRTCSALLTSSVCRKWRRRERERDSLWRKKSTQSSLKKRERDRKRVKERAREKMRKKQTRDKENN